MAGTAYHMETLRKARMIERKSEAMRKLKDGLGQHEVAQYIGDSQQAPLVFSEPGHYAQNRSGKIDRNEVVFEEVVHDPNFKYRMLKESGNTPLHVDPIYKIMYPGGQKRK